jgi:hypothetical protein
MARFTARQISNVDANLATGYLNMAFRLKLYQFCGKTDQTVMEVAHRHQLITVGNEVTETNRVQFMLQWTAGFHHSYGFNIGVSCTVEDHWPSNVEIDATIL